MISLEGLTLVHRPHARGRLDPAHVRAATCATGSSPTSSPRARTRGSTTPPTRRCGSSTRSIATSPPRGDRAHAARSCCRRCATIIAHHIAGTRFGIGVDPADGLLRQGADGYQLTWMDAKVDDWVVTPRRGKAVEINALWYNALRVLERWLRDGGRRGAAATIAAQRRAGARESFNARFWCAARGYLYDVVDGEATATTTPAGPTSSSRSRCRTRCSTRARWGAGRSTWCERQAADAGRAALAGARQPRLQAALLRRPAHARRRLSPGHGVELAHRPVRRRLAARASRRARRRARAARRASREHLDEACVGSIGEIFDAEAPFTPRGCIAQAWGVAEVLRAWRKTADR